MVSFPHIRRHRIPVCAGRAPRFFRAFPEERPESPNFLQIMASKRCFLDRGCRYPDPRPSPMWVGSGAIAQITANATSTSLHAGWVGALSLRWGVSAIRSFSTNPRKVQKTPFCGSSELCAGGFRARQQAARDRTSRFPGAVAAPRAHTAHPLRSVHASAQGPGVHTVDLFQAGICTLGFSLQ